ncbi:MBL fold metallo-hydrolase [Pseudomonas lalucatii]|nr:MBL fold metallo-hydrolase [Pseudomonas lalucatii]
MPRAPGAPGRGGHPRRADPGEHPGGGLHRRRHVRGAPRPALVLRRIPGQGGAGHPADRGRRCAGAGRPGAAGAAYPGPFAGGISLWEKATQTLFSGDILYDGPLVEDAYHSNLDDYARSLARLRRLPVRCVHGGHFPSFSGERMHELIDAWFARHP